jgi:amino acid transporter
VALVTVAQTIGGSGWERVMALALALSVIASTGTGIVCVSRMLYGMASNRMLPGVLAIVSRRFSTPIVASLVMGAKSVLVTTNAENVALEIVFGVGIVLMLLARFALRSPFFRMPLESASEPRR